MVKKNLFSLFGNMICENEYTTYIYPFTQDSLVKMDEWKKSKEQLYTKIENEECLILLIQLQSHHILFHIHKMKLEDIFDIWERLTETEKITLQRIYIFRGHEYYHKYTLYKLKKRFERENLLNKCVYLGSLPKNMYIGMNEYGLFAKSNAKL